MFYIPNRSDTSYADQAEPDAVDFEILGNRATGVLTGGAVTAQVSPALAVDVAAGTGVIDSAPVMWSGAAPVIVGGESQPRFDLVAVDAAGVVTVLKGAADSNPRFPTVDLSLYLMLGAVYVRQSVSSILATDVIDKRVVIEPTFTRVYGSTTTEAVSLLDSNAKATKVMSDGEHRWVSSILRRTADAAMEFATSFVLKASDVAQSVLILKARSGSGDQIAAQKLLDVQTNAGSTIASISGSGVLQTSNFKSGAGSPEGVLTGAQGDLYVDVNFTDANAALYLKSTPSGNTGWAAMGKHDPPANLLPTGSCYPWVGSSGSLPAGTVLMNGQLLSSTDPTYADLLAVIGNQYGGTVGVNFAVPDWRNRTPMGAGGTVDLGQSAGSVSVNIGTANMPAHVHPLEQTPHVHGVSGFPYLWAPPSESTALRPYPSNLPPVSNVPQLPYIKIADFAFLQPAEVEISMASVGLGHAISTLSPVIGCHWLLRF